MTQDERWLSRYNEEIVFLEKNHKYRLLAESRIVMKRVLW